MKSVFKHVRTLYTSHNILNSKYINGYCFVYRFELHSAYTLTWGLSVCDKSDQYNKKIARFYAIKHMDEQKPGFGGTVCMGDIVLNSILNVGGIWKTVNVLPESVHDYIRDRIFLDDYPHKHLRIMLRKWIIMHTTSKGMRSEFNYMFN